MPDLCQTASPSTAVRDARCGTVDACAGRSDTGYRVEGEPPAGGVCHCRTRRETASAPSLPFVTFPADAFAVTRGEPVASRSSPPVTRTFCGRCGSPLTYRNAGEPDLIDVMTCSLDDPEAFPPGFHVWVDHKPAWERVADGLPAYETTRAAGELARPPRRAASDVRWHPIRRSTDRRRSNRATSHNTQAAVRAAFDRQAAECHEAGSSFPFRAIRGGVGGADDRAAVQAPDLRVGTVRRPDLGDTEQLRHFHLDHTSR